MTTLSRVKEEQMTGGRESAVIPQQQPQWLTATLTRLEFIGLENVLWQHKMFVSWDTEDMKEEKQQVRTEVEKSIRNDVWSGISPC